jgi:molybdate transport system permease protein
MSPFWISLQTAAAATALTFVIGILAAWGMSRWRGRTRPIVDGLLTLPLVLPPTVVGYFLLLLFGRQSAIGRALEQVGWTLVFSWPATVIAATVVAFPLMYRTALGAFEQVSPSLLGAARTLGASEWRTLRTVILPVARPGILAGTVLAFARALGEFGATLMFAGNIPGRTQTMPVAIFFAAEGGDYRGAALWVSATAALSLASIAALHWFGQPRRPRPAATVAEPVTMPLVATAGRAKRAHLEIDIRKRLPGFALDARFGNGGRALALLGASGSGKSMTLRAIAGLENPDEGRIVLNGRVLFDSSQRVSLPPAARRVGIVFQDHALFPHLTVRQNIAFGIGGRDVLEWACLARVDELLDRYPGELSGGQQQRVALARALAMRPDALLLDEPFSSLDPHLRRRLEEDLRALLSTYTGAVVLVTHDRSEAFRMCEELAILSDGRVDAAGPRDELFARPRTLSAARVTGCKNFARMRPCDADHIRVDEWGAILRVHEHVGDATFVGIRAHHIELKDGPVDRNTLECEVLDAVESPFEVTVYLRAHKAAIEAELPRAAWRPRQTVWARLPPEHLLLLRESDTIRT